jgi:hypothetical protein
MALLWFDGFDNYGSDENILKAYDYGSFGYWRSGGRFSTSIGMYYSYGYTLYKTIPNHTQLFVGFAFNNVALNHNFLLFQDASNNDQLTLNVNSSGNIEVKRGTTILATSTNIIYVNNWDYIAVDVGFDNTTGYIQVWINGVKDIDISNIDTQNTALSGCSRLALTSEKTLQIYFDDFYIADNTGSLNNTIIPEAKVIPLIPSADTAQKDFTASTGSDNYAMVDEVTPDGDTTNVNASTNNAKDIYELSDLPAGTSDVYGVSTIVYARKDDTGVAYLNYGIKSGSTESFSLNNLLSTSYVHFIKFDETDPNTSSQWTYSTVNSLQCGISVSL